jgi:hypothetical protein
MGGGGGVDGRAATNRQPCVFKGQRNLVVTSAPRDVGEVRGAATKSYRGIASAADAAALTDNTLVQTPRRANAFGTMESPRRSTPLA